ncbi:MAG TPA: TetR/AcrR family transcriptional regulator [Anaerolineales bacterium]|nr:TetR/AcrR family transcriptional regulator [Anaerolineales bacterium]HNS61992.1 TetR/AcrR family transcriptional regulator [Anaerolineales bacterium]
MKKEVSPKDKVFQTAARMFYQHGYRAIGVDTLAAESGIGKMTLYRHYPTKDELIVAYLKDSNDLFWSNFEQITKDAPTAREKLLAFFESLQEYVKTPACYGCPFLNVATEFPETDYPGHQVALEHKQSVRARFRQLAKEAGARKPDVLADQLFFLMDGAYMASRMFGAKNPAAHLASAARVLVDASLE